MKALITTLFLASTTLAHAGGFSDQQIEKLQLTVRPSQTAVVTIDQGDDADRAKLPPEAKIMENAAACSAAVKDALAQGADPASNLDFMTLARGALVRTNVSIGDADAKICQAAAEKAKGLDARNAKAVAAAREAKLGPFKKLGVAGDKLALVDKFWTEVLGPNEADPTPQVVAKSSVLFRLIKDDEIDYTLMRYEFRGNKQVRVTSQTFHSDPPASKYR